MTAAVALPAHLDLPAAERAEGCVRLPGSKSITLRALLLSALASGTTRLEGVLESDDSKVMFDALDALGVGCRGEGSGTWIVEGCGGRFPVPTAELFMGLSGVSTRALVAVLALTGGHYRIDGVPRMRERPVRDLVDALTAIGARITYDSVPGFLPLTIETGALQIDQPIPIRGDISSQFLTGLLQALPLTRQSADVRIEGELISTPYVAITIELMRRFGVSVERDAWRTFRIPADSAYRSPGTFRVEGDASGASYFLAAGAIAPGSRVRIEGVGCDSIQGDVHFADALERMGASVKRSGDWIEAAGTGRLHGIDIDCMEIPDAAMTLAIVALFADGPTTLRGIGSWRVKETDRIAAMATELRKVGARIDEGGDWLRIQRPLELTPATIDTYDDHRMAMCFALVSLGGVPIRINDPGCVRKTYPDFFDDFLRIAR